MLVLLWIVKKVSLQQGFVSTEWWSETKPEVATPTLHLENMLLENVQASHIHTCF